MTTEITYSDYARTAPDVRPRTLVRAMDKHVIGQSNAKRVLAVAIYNHLKRIELSKTLPRIEKSNVMLVGPTGSGKTFLIESICKELGLPLGIADASCLTESGYVGADVESILLPLLQNCKMNVSLAEKGIVYIDEIDKIAATNGPGKDVTGRGVQRSLLKIIEGKNVTVTIPGQNRDSEAGKKTVDVDTSRILFIVGGAFSGIDNIINKRHGKGSIGFSAKAEKKVQDYLIPEDLVSYGIMPELMGRLHTIAELHPLTINDMVSILDEPENSLVEQYARLLWYDDITLDFEHGALRAIAEYALEHGTGARGLRSTMEKVLMDVMFNVGGDGPQVIIIDEEYVREILQGE